MQATIPDRLRGLAAELGRLRPDWRDPATYFERRDELERELRRLARTVERGQHG